MSNANVSNCQFYGVKWDGQAIESVNNVSKALLNLTELFRSQNITIDCMLKIDAEEKEDENKSSDVKQNKPKK